ncbi:polyprenyl synthetase family protein [Glaciibacter sp. 2TAF33]|uniref:polyprenyl synthetase family protein n=1 Tax=Glaciibacter sp. 2TAF33 TaxID=3233015 RepID=UPI003F928291
MIETTVATVETELERFFAASRLRASDYGEHYVALWDSLALAAAGGKRMRPALVLAAYAGFGGRNSVAAIRVGVAFELLHTAFIIHDDLIDGDLTRRGIPNVAGAFQARGRAHGGDDRRSGSWAAAAGILAGDLALSEAHRTLGTLDVDSTTRARLLDLLDRSIFVSAAGELADVTNSSGGAPASLEAVLATLEQKTAIYSFEAPLLAGAILAGATPEALNVVGCFGRLIGVAFQLTDDTLGVFGDPEETGKSALADLREGKLTALIAHARTTDCWPTIEPFIGDADLDETGAELVRAHLRACGAPQAADDLTRAYAAQALEALEAPVVPAGLRQSLTVLAEAAVSRCR